jgi:hypothetical protein
MLFPFFKDTKFIIDKTTCFLDAERMEKHVESLYKMLFLFKIRTNR